MPRDIPIRDLTHFVQHDDLKNYKYRICVAGTRYWSDYKFLCSAILNYLKEFDIAKEDVVFISGDAPSGADKLIIDFAIEYAYKWTSFVPDWEDLNVENVRVKVNRAGHEYNALAGFNRNEEMAEVLNRLITFYDGVSPGTKDMIKRVNLDGHPVRVHIIEVAPQPKVSDEPKPSSSGKSDPGKDRSHLAGWS